MRNEFFENNNMLKCIISGVNTFKGSKLLLELTLFLFTSRPTFLLKINNNINAFTALN